MSETENINQETVHSESGRSHDSAGGTVSETPTFPIEDEKSQVTGISQDIKKKNLKEKKRQLDSKKDKMPKTNVVVDCYHTNLELLIPNNAIGRDLFEQVVVSLGLKEVWFFGLEFSDSKKVPTWLKLKKKVFAQDVGKKRPARFKFKPKFYPEDVEKELIDSVAKKLFLEHIKAEIVSGDCYCPADTAVLLASFALQEQHGNYNAVLNPKGFLQNENVLPSKVNEPYELPPQDWEEKIVKLYKDHRGMSKEQATMEYLRIAQDLEMFGVNYFKIKNKKSTTLWLGVDALGINVYEKNNRLEPKTGFPWSEIKAISYRDRRFTVKPIASESPNFVFYTDKSKTNKLIMILCMGNHELYIRRRKIDVAPKERLSSARLTDINTIIEEDSQPGTSYDTEHDSPEGVTHALNGYGNEYENDDDVFNKYEDDDLNSKAHTQATAYVSEESHIRQVSPVRQTSPGSKSSSSPVRHASPLRQSSSDRHHSPSPVRRSQSPARQPTPSPDRQKSFVRNSEEPEYATVDKDLDDENDDAPFVRPTPPQLPAQRTASKTAYSGREEDVIESDLKPSDHLGFKQNSLYEPMGNTPLSALIEEVPDSPPPSLGNDSYRGVRFSESVERSRGSREYVALLEKYEHGQLHDEHVHREVYVNENKEMYYKLKNLFEDVSANPSKLSEEDLIYLKLKEEKIDKYQTLRKIRSGYTKDRVAIFEAMM